MKHLLYPILLLPLLSFAQKPLFPAYDYFGNKHQENHFPYLTTGAYLLPYNTTVDSINIRNWVRPMDSLQRHFFFVAVAFQMYDGSDLKQLTPYLPEYESDFILALRAVGFPEKDISCFTKMLAHLSSLKRSGSPFKPYYGCSVYFRDDKYARIIQPFVIQHFNHLFSTELPGGIDPFFTGVLSKLSGKDQNVLKVVNGMPRMEEMRDANNLLHLRIIMSETGQDSCKQWFYPNGALEHEEINQPNMRLTQSYYPSGKLFRSNYTHYPVAGKNEYSDTSGVVLWMENGARLYEETSSRKGFGDEQGSFRQETIWDTSGQVCFSRGNGLFNTYDLIDGKLQIVKQELRLDSSLFQPFTPLLHWDNNTRAWVDAVAKDYLRSHPWAGYRTSAQTCLNQLTQTTAPRLDSLQEAVLYPVFEAICSVYAPWAPEDSVGLDPMTNKVKNEALKKALIVHYHYNFPFSEATVERIFRIENDENVQKKLYFHQDQSGNAENGRSEWDMLVYKLQYLKQSATADELIVWMCKPLSSLPYGYKHAWEYDTMYPKQTRALRAVQDTMQRIWLPQLKKLNKMVWKKLSPEEKEQIKGLRQAYRLSMIKYRADSKLMRHRMHRNQTPSRAIFIESLYDLIETGYPNFRYMQLSYARPAGLSSNDLKALSEQIYKALGPQKAMLEQWENQLFAALAPCESIWSTPFSWYRRGKDKDMLRALNLMMIE